MRKYLFILLIFFCFLSACGGTEQSSQNKPVSQAETFNEASESLPENASSEKEKNKEEKLESLPELTVHYIDVGQGDATLFQYSDKEKEYTILYDVGDWQGNEVVPFLEKENINFIDVVIISHPHADHIGQLDKVMNHVEVGEVWMSGNSANTDLFQSAMKAILESETDYDEPRAGETYDIGPLEINVLHPGELSGGLNEDSLSLHFTYGNVSFLFTGDAYKEQERQMMVRTDDIEADFLQLGHHGSNTSSDPSFLERVNPTYAIYSAGAGNSYGHPHDEIVQLILNKGINLLGTDVNGTITIQTDGADYEVFTEKEGKVEKGNEDSGKSEKEPSKSDHIEVDCININTASIEELMEITQIGEARAKELINLRPFRSIDELTRINGIGPSRLVEIKQQGKACVGGE